MTRRRKQSRFRLRLVADWSWRGFLSHTTRVHLFEKKRKRS